MALKAAILPVTPFQQNCTLMWNDENMRGAVSDPGGDLPRIKQAAAEIGVTIEKIEGPHEDDLFLIEALPDQAAKYGFGPVGTFRPDRWLKDGDTVEFAGLTLEVRHCPGHTPGHVVFFHEPSRLAIVGDVLFQGSVGRTDFPRGDHNALVTSIRERLWPLGDDVTFVPGHGPLSTFGVERRTNPFVADENFA